MLDSKFQSRVESIVKEAVTGKTTLPSLMYSCDQTTICAVLNHSQIRKHPGWFHQFLNSQDEKENTALHIASFNNDIEMAKILIQHNCLKNVLNHHRATCLDLALFEKHFEVNFSWVFCFFLYTVCASKRFNLTKLCVVC